MFGPTFERFCGIVGPRMASILNDWRKLFSSYLKVNKRENICIRHEGHYYGTPCSDIHPMGHPVYTRQFVQTFLGFREIEVSVALSSGFRICKEP
jgi:hypothetical protein